MKTGPWLRPDFYNYAGGVLYAFSNFYLFIVSRSRVPTRNGMNLEGANWLQPFDTRNFTWNTGNLETLTWFKNTQNNKYFVSEKIYIL